MSVSDREADENSLFSGEMPSILVNVKEIVDDSSMQKKRDIDARLYNTAYFIILRVVNRKALGERIENG
jgi:hypothetical protein